MRWLICLSVLMFLPLVVHASDEWIYNIESAKMDLKVGSTIVLNPTAGDYSIDEVVANMTFIPLSSTRQSVRDFEHGGKLRGNDAAAYLLFTWTGDDGRELEYGYTATILTKTGFPLIDHKVDFPIMDYNDEMERSLECTDKIDCDSPSIIRKASDLASGKTDLFDVVFTLATFASGNINYNLAYSDFVDSASNVLKNKQGVCSEYTTLLIALCRSIGIPARYVSGEAYSNTDYTEGFGEHAWAEVYFPGFGWIPFDPTYDEYGMVDATHIELKKSVDSNEPSTKFEWVGRNIEMSTDPLEISVNLRDSGEPMRDFLAIDANMLRPEVGIGSYNLLMVDITNLLDTYVTTTLYISETNDLYIEGEKTLPIFLTPGQQKTFYWVVRASTSLSDEYRYEFPMSIHTKQMMNASASFKVRKDFVVYSYTDVYDSIVRGEEEERKVYSGEVVFDCDAQKEEYYVGQDIRFDCLIDNGGNIGLSDLKVCLIDDCKLIDVPIAQSKMVSFTNNISEEGLHEVTFIAENEDISKVAYETIKISSRPVLVIANLTHPDTVKLGEDVGVNFSIQRISTGIPEDVKFDLIHKNFRKEWRTPKMIRPSIDVEEIIDMDMLNYDENEFMIKVTYHDNTGKEYCDYLEFEIDIPDVGLFRRIMIFLTDVFSVKKNELDMEMC